MELVSAIIPAYNAQDYIKATIDSALNQTYPRLEIIVVDDGSTDDTPAILAGYGEKIRVVCQPNSGRSAANNTGIAHAKGEWIAFLDSDDTWMPQKISRQIELCKNKAISHTDSYFLGDHIENDLCRSSLSPLYHGSVLKELLVSNFIVKSTVLVRRDVICKHGCFDERYDCVIDWPLWLKICAEQELGYVPEPLTHYRVHLGSVSMKSRQTLPSHLRVISEAFSSKGVGKNYPELRKQALKASFQINIHFAASSGDWQFALRCCLKSLYFAPFSSRNWKNLIKSILIPFGRPY
ncbi:MAG: glycosyltransferase [Desulfobacula sp.]|nr:glycosyltransferase [Desulfobacula sp.]